VNAGWTAIIGQASSFWRALQAPGYAIGSSLMQVNLARQDLGQTAVRRLANVLRSLHRPTSYSSFITR
jgi:hypothetical protein